MIQHAHYGGAIGANNAHTQVKWASVYKVTPSLTNMGELAPQKLGIPMILIIQSITIEYAEEYIIVEPMDGSRISYIVS